MLALVNNAGISRDDLTPTLGDDEWSAVIDTDLTAAFRMTRRALVPMMRSCGDGGSSPSRDMRFLTTIATSAPELPR